MSIKQELSNLKEQDLWSFMLFVLFKVKDVPEYSGLSELAFILDKKNMLKLCEYFGGCTITVPRIEEFEMLLYGMLLYQCVDIEHKSLEEAIKLLNNDDLDTTILKQNYRKIKEVLADYQFTSRSRI